MKGDRQRHGTSGKERRQAAKDANFCRPRMRFPAKRPEIRETKNRA
jgi:hypothetical protein